jgi:hypothetical protein
METNLTHSVGVKPVEILHDARHLPLQLELTTVLEVQAGGIDHGKQNAVETGLVDIYSSGLDARGSLDSAAHEAVIRRALFGSGGGGYICCVEKKTQEGGLAGTLSSSNLDRVGEHAQRDVRCFRTLTIRLNLGGTRARR